MTSVVPTVVQTKPVSKFFNWTPAKAESAAKEGKYMKIEKKSGDLILSGALKKWKSDNSFVYVPQFRVAGSLQTVNPDGTTSFPIYEFLIEVIKLSESDSRKVIQEANYSIMTVCGQIENVSDISTENLKGSLAEAFKSELASLEALKKSKPVPKKEPTFTLDQITALGKEMKESKDKLTVQKTRSKPAESGSSNSNSTRKQTPLKRLLKAGDDKYLDVSNFSTKGTDGVKLTVMPKSGNTKKAPFTVKINDPETGNIVHKMIGSNSLESLKMFLETIYSDSNVVNAYLNMWTTTKNTVVNTKPVASVVSGSSVASNVITVPGVPVVAVPSGVSVVQVPQIVPASSLAVATSVISPVMTMNGLFHK